MIRTQQEKEMFIVSGGMIVDILTNKKFEAITKELFFSVPNKVRLPTHCLLIKIYSKRVTTKCY